MLLISTSTLSLYRILMLVRLPEASPSSDACQVLAATISGVI